jgi:hypothetical protein
MAMRFLDFVISVVFFFTLTSILVSVVMEWISQRLRRREVFLRRGLQRLVQDYGLYVRVVNHPTVIASSGRREGSAGPSYLAGTAFAHALVDSMISRVRQMNMMSGVPLTGGIPLSQLGGREAVQELERWGLMTARALRPMAAGASSDDELKRRIASWYDQAMERISGAYKRGTQAWLFWLGLLIAAVLNIDTIAVARHLWMNAEARQSFAGMAESQFNSGQLEKNVRRAEAITDLNQEVRVDNEKAKVNTDATAERKGSPRAANSNEPAGTTSADSNAAADYKRVLTSANIPLGYACTSDDHPWTTCANAITQLRLRDVVAIFVGWVLTAIAVSFGAGFWFDVLAKVINIRATGQKPAKAPRTAAGEGQ